MDNKSKQTNQNVDITKPVVKKFTHRYFCDACTGVAFMHVEGEPVPNTVRCQACGKVQKFKNENLIKL